MIHVKQKNISIDCGKLSISIFFNKKIHFAMGFFVVGISYRIIIKIIGLANKTPKIILILSQNTSPQKYGRQFL